MSNGVDGLVVTWSWVNDSSAARYSRSSSRSFSVAGTNELISTSATAVGAGTVLPAASVAQTKMVWAPNPVSGTSARQAPKSLPVTACAGVRAPPGASAHATPACPPAIPLWLSVAVPCIDTVALPAASPITFADGVGNSTTRCGGAASRPTRVRTWTEACPSRSATRTVIGRALSGNGARVTVVW